MMLVTPKVGAFVQQTGFSKGGFVEHLSQTQAAQQSVTRIISMYVLNSVTPYAADKHDLLFNRRASE
jgi:hypothetical protein